MPGSASNWSAVAEFMSIRSEAGALLATLASGFAFGLVDGCSAKSANAVSSTAIKRASFTVFSPYAILAAASVMRLATCFYELQLFLLGDTWLETAPAARLVHTGGAHYDQ